MRFTARAGNRYRNVTVVLAGVLIVVMLTASAALGAVVYRYMKAGAVTAVRAAVTATDSYGATGSTFTAIPGNQVSVSVPAGQKAVLIITFSFEEQCQGNQYCYVGAYVDGTLLSPGEIQVQRGGIVAYELRSFQWVTGVLGPGTHWVTMASRVDGDATMFLNKRTLTVMRARA